MYVASHFNPDGCVLGKKFVLQVARGHGIIFHQTFFILDQKAERGYQTIGYLPMVYIVRQIAMYHQCYMVVVSTTGMH